MESASDENRMITADIIAAAWNDEGFKQELLAHPTEVLRSAGISGLEDGHTIIAHENTNKRKHIVLPSNVSPHDYLPAVGELLKNALPLPAAAELTLVQNSPDVTHLVIPSRPPISSPDASHAMLGAAAGWEAVTTTSQANLNIVQVVTTVMDGGIAISAAVTASVAAVVLT